jgi:hypothetical protein
MIVLKELQRTKSLLRFMIDSYAIIFPVRMRLTWEMSHDLPGESRLLLTVQDGPPRPGEQPPAGAAARKPTVSGAGAGAGAAAGATGAGAGTSAGAAGAAAAGAAEETKERYSHGRPQFLFSQPATLRAFRFQQSANVRVRAVLLPAVPVARTACLDQGGPSIDATPCLHCLLARSATHPDR